MSTMRRCARWWWLVSCLVVAALAGCAVTGADGEAVAEYTRKSVTPTAAPTPTVTPSLCPKPPPLVVQHTGDVTINSQADANQYAAVAWICGNLTIHAGRKDLGQGIFQPNLQFSMPNLTAVTGNVILDADRTEMAALPKLASVGGKLTVTLTAFNGQGVERLNRIDLPKLSKVGGELELLTAIDQVGANFRTFDFGMNQLAEIGGKLRLVNELSNTSITGINGLKSVPGDMEIVWWHYDLYADKLLTAVQFVAGNLHFVAPYHCRFLLPELVWVAGSLTIDAYADAAWLELGRMFPKLRWVLGDLSLTKTEPYLGCADGAFDLLTLVQGTISLTSVSWSGHLGTRKAGEHLTAGGVTITDSAFGSLPFAADFQVQPTAIVTVENNPAMCTCLVNRLQTHLTNTGWPGQIIRSGNGSTATGCQPCPSCS